VPLEPTMMNSHELVISTLDAEGLAAVLNVQGGAAFAPDPRDQLAELLAEAWRVPADKLPADRVAMGSSVTYREHPTGVSRTIMLAYPEAADAASGRISVLSPVGLALIGRKRGDALDVALPNRRLLEIQILRAGHDFEPLRKAA
jgi:regulator of nucleoside diphosphate kinase